MRRSKFLLLALAALLLASCSLARAEDHPEAGDRWVGLYVVPTQGYASDFYDNPNLEEYGSTQVETGKFGVLSFPQEVLFAVEDEVGNYTFPGMENGYSLFYIEGEDEVRSHYTAIISNMDEHENANTLAYTDEGTSITLSGAVHFGPPLGATDWDPYTDGTIWRYYNVYQTADGRVYLNGYGDSTNGPMSKTQTETRTRHENGKTVQDETVSVTVAIKTVPRLDRLVVTQFDSSNQIVQSEDLPLQNDRTEVYCQPETAWLLVEETSLDGTERAVYSVPEGEDPVSHSYVLLDDSGFGSLAHLNIYGWLPVQPR